MQRTLTYPKLTMSTYCIMMVRRRFRTVSCNASSLKNLLLVTWNFHYEFFRHWKHLFDDVRAGTDCFAGSWLTEEESGLDL